MADLSTLILRTVSARNYLPLKAKSLARKLGLEDNDYGKFRQTVRDLLQQGKLKLGKNATIHSADPLGTAVGIFRRLSSGAGIVRTHATEKRNPLEYHIPEQHCHDALTGDEVLMRVLRKPKRNVQGVGEVLKIRQRATQQFVGTYIERDGDFLVRVDGTVFTRSIRVEDARSKGVKPGDKVVIEVLRFPTLEERGEGVIVEILGPRGKPKVELLAVVRALGIPDSFPEEVLAEARAIAARFSDKDLDGREDFTSESVITIDPVDAKDFDDAVSLTVDPRNQHWHLTVHIADVGHFAPPGSALDREARKRGNSVYLPQTVIPMFPEVISNGLASLQEGRRRYVKTVQIEYTPAGQRVSVRFANGVIQVKKRFVYEHVSEILANPEGERARTTDPDILTMLLQMRDLALILRARRFRRGALELTMPEAVLDYDEHGHVTGAHFAVNDISHQIIEEFMLAANEAVANHLNEKDIVFLRRIHPPPEPMKLKAFAEFARILGHPIARYQDRFELQRVLRETADKPERYAIHYALLRSLKQAVYSPEKEDHYALASSDYCHFTSPIRRYPDLTVHRLLNQLLKSGRAGADFDELTATGDHCSKTERRAENAEREIIKLRLLYFLAERLGMQMHAVITGVTEYGFFAQGEQFPAEGLVHVSSLTDDYYYYEETAHTLEGRRTGKRYRLGDRVHVEVVHVDVNRRQLDLRIVAEEATPTRTPEHLRRKKSHLQAPRKKKRKA